METGFFEKILILEKHDQLFSIFLGILFVSGAYTICFWNIFVHFSLSISTYILPCMVTMNRLRNDDVIVYNNYIQMRNQVMQIESQDRKSNIKVHSNQNSDQLILKEF